LIVSFRESIISDTSNDESTLTPNLNSENLLAKSDFTDEHKDEKRFSEFKLGVSVDSSLEVSEMIDSLNETIKTIEKVEEIEEIVEEVVIVMVDIKRVK
jgi:hypothetical protein